MSVIPTTRQSSSRDQGWTSLLLDVHAGIASHDAYDSISTTDPRIGVTVSGRYTAELFMGGAWRRDAHAPGSINVHRTGEQTRYRFPEPQDHDCSFALVYLPLALLEGAADHLSRPGQSSDIPSFRSAVSRDPALTQMTFALMAAMDQGIGDFYAETAASWLAVHMITRYGADSHSDSRNPGDITDQRLARVVEYISTNFALPLTLEQLAVEACISKYHFNRLFTRKVGQTPHRYLSDVRLDAAGRMLITTDLSIAEIKSRCGFSASSHFSTAFAGRFGMSPTVYRTSSRGR